MYIGNLKIKSSIFLAPMSGVSDYPYREIVKKFKPGLVFSEMIASRALVEKNRKTLKMIKKEVCINLNFLFPNQLFLNDLLHPTQRIDLIYSYEF